MTRRYFSRQQRGATLVVAMIMLVLLTLIVTTAVKMSTGNLMAVGNMQARDEAVAAANVAVEDVIGSLLTGGSTVQPPARDIGVDLDRDGTDDYTVAVAAPTCLRATKLPGSGGAGSGSSQESNLPTSGAYFNSLWDIDATVTDTRSGASVRLHQGILVKISQTQCDAVCAPASGGCS